MLQRFNRNMMQTIVSSIEIGRRDLRLTYCHVPQDEGDKSKDEGDFGSKEKDAQGMEENLDDLVCSLIQAKFIDDFFGGNTVELSQVTSWSETWNGTKVYTLKLNNQKPPFPFDPRLNDKIRLCKGNILNLEDVDAIVCGRKTSPFDENGTGAVITSVGPPLPAKYVIKTAFVSGDPKSLRAAYQNSFNLMLTHGLRTIAFEPIGVADGYTNGLVAEIAVRVTRSFLETNWDRVYRIVFVLPRSLDLRIYADVCQEFFPLDVERGVPQTLGQGSRVAET